MGKGIPKKRIERYCRIAGQLNEDPFMTVREIGCNTGLSRNTVAIYLKEMYSQNVLIGPWMSLKPHSNYREYVYLMNFSDPSHIFRGLKEFPNTLYHGMTFGSFNTLVITDRQLDFPQLKGFESMVYQGVKGYSHTPRTEYFPWDQSFEKMYEVLEDFTPFGFEPKRDLYPLNWGKDEWKLYHAFRLNVRRSAAPVLNKIKVQYETYAKWMKNLKDHCTLHTEFYPEGCNNYMDYCLLLDSDYKRSVTSLFSFFPTTPLIMEMNNQLLISVKVMTSVVVRSMICMLYDMKTKKMIREVCHAVVLHDQR